MPGREESAEVSNNNRSPKGNRMMRRLLNQVAHAAVKTKGSRFQALYRRFVIRLGHNKPFGPSTHRLCRLTWKILHQGVQYIEFGTRSNSKAAKRVGFSTVALRCSSVSVGTEDPNCFGWVQPLFTPYFLRIYR